MKTSRKLALFLSVIFCGMASLVAGDLCAIKINDGRLVKEGNCEDTKKNYILRDLDEKLLRRRDLSIAAKVRITVKNQTCFIVEWNEITTAKSYIVSLSSSAETKKEESSSNTAEICGLKPGTEYNATVVVTYKTGDSNNSTDVATQITAPPTPSNVIVSSITTTSFTVSWDVSKSAESYEVKVFERMTDGSDGTEAASEAPTSTSQLISNLTAGTTYKVKVRARNAGGWSLQNTEVPQITSHCQFITGGVCYWIYYNNTESVNFTQAEQICAKNGSVPGYFPTRQVYNETLQNLRSMSGGWGCIWTGIKINSMTAEVSYPYTEVYMNWRGVSLGLLPWTSIYLCATPYDSMYNGIGSISPDYTWNGVFCQHSLN